MGPGAESKGYFGYLFKLDYHVNPPGEFRREVVQESSARTRVWVPD